MDNTPDPAQSRAFLSDNRNEMVLVFSGTVPASFASGTILLHPDKPPSMFINEVGTRDSYLRQGLASLATEALIAIARKRGCKGVWLGTEMDNLAAIGLYRSLGAEEVNGIYFGWDDAL